MSTRNLILEIAKAEFGLRNAVSAMADNGGPHIRLRDNGGRTYDLSVHADVVRLRGIIDDAIDVTSEGLWMAAAIEHPRPHSTQTARIDWQIRSARALLTWALREIE